LRAELIQVAIVFLIECFEVGCDFSHCRDGLIVGHEGEVLILARRLHNVLEGLIAYHVWLDLIRQVDKTPEDLDLHVLVYLHETTRSCADNRVLRGSLNSLELRLCLN
jgi:hypothetical protein